MNTKKKYTNEGKTRSFYITNQNMAFLRLLATNSKKSVSEILNENLDLIYIKYKEGQK